MKLILNAVDVIRMAMSNGNYCMSAVKIQVFLLFLSTNRLPNALTGSIS